MLQSLEEAQVVDRRRMPPDDAGVLRLTSNIGYGLSESLADLIDNAIDAAARHVLVRVYLTNDRLARIAVIDDGTGMSRDALREAMRLGRSDKPATSLGKYGIGLKAASLSHTRVLTVASRPAPNEATAVRYTIEGIEDGWKLDELDSTEATHLLDQAWTGDLSTFSSGTVVMWDELTRFSSAEGSATRRFGQFARHLLQHLGLHFQRFVSRGLSVAVDLFDTQQGTAGLARTVEAVDPFPARSGHRGYPVTFHAEFGRSLRLALNAHIWPANSREPGYNLDGRAAQRQGLYFYRNDRLIQAGGWNGWRNNDAEPHLSLARVMIDLPPDADGSFGLNAQKNGIVVPPDFVERLGDARSGDAGLADYVRVAQEVYRARDTDEGRMRAVPGPGTSARLRKELRRALVDEDDKPEEIPIRWATLPGDQFFAVDPNGREIVLNQRFRDAVTPRGRSRNDAPLLKTLLFLLVGDDVLRERLGSKVLDRHASINRSVLAALTDDRAT